MFLHKENCIYYAHLASVRSEHSVRCRSLMTAYILIYNIYLYIGAEDSQINHNSIQRNIYSLKLILLHSFYCLVWSILLTWGGVGVGWVFIWLLTHNYLIIPMGISIYLFIYYLIAYVISFYQSNYCFLMSSEIYKDYREY